MNNPTSVVVTGLYFFVPNTIVHSNASFFKIKRRFPGSSLKVQLLYRTIPASLYGPLDASETIFVVWFSFDGIVGSFFLFSKTPGLNFRIWPIRTGSDSP